MYKLKQNYGGMPKGTKIVDVNLIATSPSMYLVEGHLITDSGKKGIRVGIRCNRSSFSEIFKGIKSVSCDYCGNTFEKGSNEYLKSSGVLYAGEYKGDVVLSDNGIICKDCLKKL